MRQPFDAALHLLGQPAGQMLSAPASLPGCLPARCCVLAGPQHACMLSNAPSLVDTQPCRLPPAAPPPRYDQPYQVALYNLGVLCEAKRW